jgi:hypothetical protein
MTWRELKAFKTQLLETRPNPDLRIVFNGTEHQAHWIVVAQKSRYFNALLFSEYQEQHGGTLVTNLQGVSDSDFKLFLDYFYGARWNSEYLAPMMKLADYFQCDELSSECEEIPLYSLGCSPREAAWIFAELIPSLTLVEDSTMLESEQLMGVMLWFKVQSDQILKLELDVLSLISHEWLRYVFGKAPCHWFNNETMRLDNAIDLYLRMGHSESLFSALFESINYSRIPSSSLLNRKYLFLYRAENDMVRRKVIGPRGAALPADELKTEFGSFFSSEFSCIVPSEFRFQEDVEVEFYVNSYLFRDPCKMGFKIIFFDDVNRVGKYENYTCSMSGYLLFHGRDMENVSWQHFSVVGKPKSHTCGSIAILELPEWKVKYRRDVDRMNVVAHITLIDITKA